METTELIKRCIAIAPFFVGLIADTLLIAGPASDVVNGAEVRSRWPQ